MLISDKSQAYSVYFCIAAIKTTLVEYTFVCQPGLLNLQDNCLKHYAFFIITPEKIKHDLNTVDI